eukprot:GHVQ01024129.1.p1 GENE.GHVQ01024129.1~~GHVQ01024129.1.p1  ORF type:complete len:112 (-),score=3.26 GHVQ01024129.1:621-956(-)
MCGKSSLEWRSSYSGIVICPEHWICGFYAFLLFFILSPSSLPKTLLLVYSLPSFLSCYPYPRGVMVAAIFVMLASFLISLCLSLLCDVLHAAGTRHSCVLYCVFTHDHMNA